MIGKPSTDVCIILLLGYARSPFREFGSYLRSVVGSNENYIQIILKQYKSNFINSEKPPDVYSMKVISEAVYTKTDHEGTLQYNNDNISVKTKPFSRNSWNAKI